MQYIETEWANFIWKKATTTILAFSYLFSFGESKIWLLDKFIAFGSSLSSLLGLCQRDRPPWEFGLNSYPNEHLLSLFIINSGVSNASSLFVGEPIQYKEKAASVPQLSFIFPLFTAWSIAYVGGRANIKFILAI